MIRKSAVEHILRKKSQDLSMRNAEGGERQGCDGKELPICWVIAFGFWGSVFLS